MVMVPPAQLAVTPAGKPLAAPMPVAAVVVWVMLGLNAVLIHKVGELDAGVTVLVLFTVMVPVAFTVPHPPLRGMV